MPFKGRYTRVTGKRLGWDNGQYLPGRAPTIIGSYPQEWSSRLYLSSNHGTQIRLGKLGKGSAIGGDFWVLHHYYDDFNSLGSGLIRFTPNNNLASIATPHYETNQYAVKASFNDTDFPIVTPTSKATLEALATDAISQMAPTKPQADFASFLGEMREGLPSAIGIRDTSKQRLARARNAGDEYLNVEFGWKPLLKDLRDFASSYKRSHDILDSYHKKANTVLRREHRFPIEQTTEVVTGSPKTPVPILSTANYGTSGAGTYTKTTKTTIERWVVASFVYYLPDFDDSVRGEFDRRRSDMNQLFGTKISPNMAWNMTPWTWAADWVGNAGSIAANLTYFQTDGLVMPYCYVMETKSVKETHEVHGSGQMYRSYPNARPYLMQSFETVSKYRTSGTPYGFGLNWNGFSQKQLGILAALGISKSAG